MSRRDFMKVLGLSGAGLGAASLVAPQFHDLDEVLSAPEAATKRPWFTKERDFENLTVEIDWAKKERYDKRKLTVVTPEESERRVQIQLDNIKNKWNETGMSHNDYALMAGSRQTPIGVKIPLVATDSMLHYTNAGTTKPAGYTYKDLGLPRWSATPEENLRMVTAALRFWGAAEVGAHEITTNTQKIFYKSDDRGRPYRFADVPVGYSDDDNACVIPNSVKTVLTWIVPMSRVGQYTGDSGFNILNKVSMGIGYSMGDIIQARIMAFIGHLGYQGLSRSCGGMNVASGNLAGLGEHGRCDYLLNSQYGANVRYSDFMLTDLPMQYTKPIDQGMWKFCQTCIKCGQLCPSGAIPVAGDPTYEILNPQSNGYGLKSYHVDYDLCHPYRGQPGSVVEGGCGICQSVCVFSKMEGASIHETVKAVVSSTSVLNSFFRNMDDFMGYGEFKQPDDFWNDVLKAGPVFAPWGVGNS
jgi:reductive dehalogenase